MAISLSTPVCNSVKSGLKKVCSLTGRRGGNAKEGRSY